MNSQLVDMSTRERLSKLELEEYSGNASAFSKEDRKMWLELMSSLVRMSLILKRGECDSRIHTICFQAQGEYKTFGELRKKIIELSLRRLSYIGAAVLVDGVYVGEPEDLLNHRKDKSSVPMYPLNDFGKKIGKIKFVGGR